jgi:hypothetical protein
VLLEPSAAPCLCGAVCSFEAAKKLLVVLAAHAFYAALIRRKLPVHQGQTLDPLIGIGERGVESIGEAIVLLLVDLDAVDVEVRQVEISSRGACEQFLDAAQVVRAGGEQLNRILIAGCVLKPFLAWRRRACRGLPRRSQRQAQRSPASRGPALVSPQRLMFRSPGLPAQLLQAARKPR